MAFGSLATVPVSCCRPPVSVKNVTDGLVLIFALFTPELYVTTLNILIKRVCCLWRPRPAEFLSGQTYFLEPDW